jgi:NAD(P)-dependent dehydrogenase (short-subunit alcohol dehydrogenase family)
MRLDGKVAVITGAASGIGLAVDGAKAAAVFNADRYRIDFQLME